MVIDTKKNFFNINNLNYLISFNNKIFLFFKLLIIVFMKKLIN